MIAPEIFLVGIVATIVSDLWQQIQKPVTGIPASNWPVTGRWVIGFRKGRIYDPGVAKSPSIPGEAVVGWTFHYVIGVIYGSLYLGFVYLVAYSQPNWLNGFVFGLVTLAAPLLFMKPAMGGGLFGLKAPNPSKGLFLSITTHATFGLGLYWGVLLYRALTL